MEMTLFERDGKKLLGHFDKNGYFFVLDRTNGELQHVTPFVDRIDWGVITRDGKVTPRKYPDKEGEPVHFYPGPAGAKEWTHAAYSPETDMFYVPVADVGATATRRRREFKEGMPYWGAAVQVDIDDMAGSVSAFDSHGEEKWRWRLDYPMAASVLATAGDLVFAGTPTGEFVALNARTGEKLWEFQCGSGHHSSPLDVQRRRQAVRRRAGRLGWLARGHHPRNARRGPRQRVDRIRPARLIPIRRTRSETERKERTPWSERSLSALCRSGSPQRSQRSGCPPR